MSRTLRKRLAPGLLAGLWVGLSLGLSLGLPQQAAWARSDDDQSTISGLALEPVH